ncbi:MAG TPA: META domain-containing protein [Ktedonobacterales bacterium]|nr:META domain-containing protein [Ktedonobacterales bacterium]
MALDNTTWRLVSLTDAGAPDATPNPDDPITLAFVANDDGSRSIAGSGGVNRYMTTYTTTGDDLTIEPAASTRMMGPPDVMALEGRYLQALAAATRYEVVGDDLEIFYADGELRFTRAAA